MLANEVAGLCRPNCGLSTTLGHDGLVGSDRAVGLGASGKSNGVTELGQAQREALSRVCPLLCDRCGGLVTREYWFRSYAAFSTSRATTASNSRSASARSRVSPASSSSQSFISASTLANALT